MTTAEDLTLHGETASLVVGQAQSSGTVHRAEDAVLFEQVVARADAIRSDAAREVQRRDAARADAIRSDAAREVQRRDAARADAIRSDAARETQRRDAARADAIRSDAAREVQRRDAARADAIRSDAARETQRPEPARERIAPTLREAAEHNEAQNRRLRAHDPVLHDDVDRHIGRDDVQARERLREAVATIQDKAATQAHEKFRKGYAQQLGVGPNGDVHHAVELQILSL